MMSFFTKPVYFREDGDNGKKFPQRISTMIRGEQIAEYVGGKLNPTEGYDNDVRVYVKPRKLENIKPGAYIDVLDDLAVTENVKARPDLKVIAMSGPHYDWLKTFMPNEIVHIPHQHMNFERNLRDRKEVTVCGYVGANNWRHKKINRGVGEALEKAGFKFIPLFTFETREDIINFYKSIDIQVIGYFGYHEDVPYYHQKKIVDAMSFGIPTIAGPKLGYRDVDDFYLKVHSMDELVAEALRMKDREQYNQWPGKIIEEAEKYHISNIAELYKNL